ncbi:hypothetical protein D3C71_978190 [compost metagenome]
MHTNGFGDVPGNLDDGGMDQHLRTRLVQLTHDTFDGSHLRRLGDQHQRILAFVGLDHEGSAGRCVFAGANGGRYFSALPHAFQNLSQLLGIAVTQTDHPGIVRDYRGRNVQAASQFGQALANRGRADEDQAVGPAVGQHLDGGVGIAFAQ